MNHSTGKPTKAEEARFKRMKALGCIACLIEDKPELDDSGEPVEPQIHHYLRGGKRISHAATVPLCYWHHNGLPYDGMPSRYLLQTLGPSFHKHTRAFRLRYGEDAALVERVNDEIGD